MSHKNEEDEDEAEEDGEDTKNILKKNRDIF